MNLNDLDSDEINIKFSDLFKFKGILGSGTFGTVVSAIDKETNKECAVKVSLLLMFTSSNNLINQGNIQRKDV